MSEAKPWMVGSPAPLTSHSVDGLPGLEFSQTIALGVGLEQPKVCARSGAENKRQMVNVRHGGRKVADQGSDRRRAIAGGRPASALSCARAPTACRNGIQFL